MSLLAELKRRNVIRVGVAYALIAWVFLQVVDFVAELTSAPAWLLQFCFVAAILGGLATLIFSWVFEMTPEGIKREAEVDRSQSITPQTGRKLDRVIIVFLAVVIVLLVGERFLISSPEKGTEANSMENADAALSETPAPQAAPKPALPLHERSVAVLPFMALSSGADDEYFADGLTEEILNSLAQLPELRVTARTSAFSFKGKDLPVGEIASTLGVQHIVEGSVRRSGERLRVTAQLVRAADGFHLWSENYDSTEADTIAVQEDIAVQIATSLDVVLDEKRHAAMRKAGLRDPTAFIALQKARQAANKAHGAIQQSAELLTANRYYDEVLQRVPDYAPALVEHSDPYVHIIVDLATDEPLPGVPEETKLKAQAQALEDLARASENARNFEERNAIDLDRAVLAGQFGGLTERLTAYLDTTDCTHPSWGDPMATIFGYADRLAERLALVSACDPLWATVRFSEARANLWAGSPAITRALAEAALGELDHPWLEAALIYSMLATGEFESARSSIGSVVTDPDWRGYLRLNLAAAEGDRELAEKLMQTEPIFAEGNFLLMTGLAQVGNREAANKLAAKIDGQAFGPLPLVLIILWCHCGAPFDLEATPNFAAKLAEGNLPWPPTTVIRYPLKDW